MSTVTQRIPNFLLGISQQPDNRKIPGQVRDSVNTFPDYALGLLKRPGGQFNAELQGATSSGKWFSILRDPQEKYVAQYDDNVFRVWSLIDGSPRVVDMGDDTGVPGTCNLTNYQTDLDAYNTAVTTTATRLAELHEAQAEYAEVLAGQNDTETDLFAVNYTYPVGSVEQYLVSGILKKADGVYVVKNNNTVIQATTALPANYALGVEVTDEHPLIAAQGNRVYKAILTVAAEYDASDLSTAETAMNTAQTNYDNAVTAEATALSNLNSEISNCAITTIPGASLTIVNAGTGLTDGTYNNRLTDAAPVSGATGLKVNLTISGGQLTEVEIHTDPGGYLSGDTIIPSNSAFDGIELSYNSSAYLNGATADDIEVLTLNDYTFVLNKAREVAFTADQTAAKDFYAFGVLKVIGLGHYKIFLDDEEAGSVEVTSSNNKDDADEIIGDLVTAINGFTHTNGKQWTATAIGPGIFIEDTEDFDFRVVGGPGEGSFFGFKDTVPTVASLPLQCYNGYKVKVVNSEDVNADDMYVKFVTDSGDDDEQPASGPGVWEETNGFEISTTLDPLTLPHLLVRLPDGSFYFGPPDGSTQQGVELPLWGTRDVGDLTTNPDPSFVGQTLNNVFFYRNRLGFLSNESVILSKAGDYFNFFATTALTVTDDDPIDVSASSIKPVNLRYVKPATPGLVLFSEFQQFLIAGNDDILTPKTVKITELSSYECDPDVEAVPLGTTLAFISKTQLYSRLFEIGNISLNNPPVMVEPTQYVPELVPQTIDSMIASPALSIISMGTIGGSTLYQFRFTQQGNTRAATTWYKWNLTGTLLDQFFDVSTYYAVVNNGNDEVYIQSYDLTQASEEGYLTLPTGEKTDVCLDLWDVNPYREYDPDDDGSDITRVYLPYDEVSDATFSVVLLGRYIGASDALTNASVGSVLYPTVEGTAGAYYADITGDYRGRDMIIGYIYNMEVELPKFFLTKIDGQTSVSDFTSDLILHRIKVSTGLSGPVKYQISITGRPEWSQTIEAVQPNVYDLNNVNLSAEAVHNIPLYQRNDNLSLKIIGDSPLPVTLLSLNWEGRYNTGFYKRS